MAIKPDTVGIVAKHMPTTLAFYRTLGLDIPQDQDNEPHVEFHAPNGFVLGFDSQEMVEKLDSDWSEPQAGGRITLQFSCDSVEEVNETYKKLIEAGYQSYKEPWDAFWGQRFARVLDPDKNIVSFFAEIG